jgi:hypothetical protein
LLCFLVSYIHGKISSLRRQYRQLIAALVVLVTAMPFDPVKLDLVLLAQLDQLLS